MEQDDRPTVGTGPDELANWLPVVEAVAYCQSLGLSRTPKTIRKWAQQARKAQDGAGDITVRAQDTENGFRWLIERASLDVKIKQELEYERRAANVPTGSHQTEQVSTGEDPAEPVHTGADGSNGKNSDERRDRIKELEDEVYQLTVSKRVSEQFTAQLVKERDAFLDRVTELGHTIGVLETEKKQLQLEAGDSDAKSVNSQQGAEPADAVE